MFMVGPQQKGELAIGSKLAQQQASHWQYMRWHLRHGVPT
jgi:hypothetical protein